MAPSSSAHQLLFPFMLSVTFLPATLILSPERDVAVKYPSYIFALLADISSISYEQFATAFWSIASAYARSHALFSVKSDANRYPFSFNSALAAFLSSALIFFKSSAL